MDFAIGRGQLAAVRATVHGITPYISTGAVQVAAVMKLLDGETAKVGFASASQGLRPPLPARLPRAARPGAGHRHPSLSDRLMAIIDFFDRGWRINPHGRRLHPGRPPLQLRRSRRAVVPDRQRACSPLGFAQGDQGRGLGRQRRDGVDLHARAVARRTCAGSRSVRATRRTRTTTSSTRSTAKCCSSSRSSPPSSPSCGPAAEGQALDLHRRRVAGGRRCALADAAGSRTSRPRAPNVTVDLDDVVVLSATGGTTGAPKGVMNTHRSTADDRARTS
ncbi:MAG: AMP-binding protein [Desulfosudis oleivorans]|nr:AMP-binding protein [Desulfosudis oleivorans]